MNTDPTKSPEWMSHADADYYGLGGDPDIEQPTVEHIPLPNNATALEAGAKRAELMQDGEWRSL